MIKVFKYHKDAVIPSKPNGLDAGYDLVAVEDVFIPVGETEYVNIGLSIEIPEGWVGLICDRSSMAAKGLNVTGGVIDSGYNGEIKVILNNISNTHAFQYLNGESRRGYWVLKNQRVAQILFIKHENVGFVETKTLWNSQRGNNGLGSSGL